MTKDKKSEKKVQLALDFWLDCGILVYKKDKKEPLTRKKIMSYTIKNFTTFSVLRIFNAKGKLIGVHTSQSLPYLNKVARQYQRGY